MIQYHLIPERENQDLVTILKKISDYMISFTGDIGVRTINDASIEISYPNTSFTAICEVSGKKITLETHEDDSVTINLIKNLSNNSGFRIYNTKGYYLPNDPKIMDISSIGIKKEIWGIFKTAGLTPLFQYRDNLVFFCKDKKGMIHLINRHYLEFLMNNKNLKIDKTELSTVVAKDISTFIALFDRGLISLVFPKYKNDDVKVSNISGFDIDKMDKSTVFQVTNFKLNKDKQTFIQEGTTEKIMDKKYLALKINQDYSYKNVGNKNIKVINMSVFYN